MGRQLSIVAAAVVFAAVLPAGAGEPPLDPATAVRIALDNHPMLDAAQAEVDGAEALRGKAGTGWYPRVDLVEEGMRSNDPVFVFGSKLRQEVFSASDFDLGALNTPDPFTTWATRVELRQNVWDGGMTRWSKRGAEAGVGAARSAASRTRDEIAYGALEAFWNLALAQTMTGVAEDAERAASGNLDLTAERVDSGLAVPSDRMAAEVRLAEVQEMLARARSAAEVARAALARALGLDAAPVRPLAVPDPDLGPPVETVDSRIERALASRDDLQAIDRRLEQVEAGERLARVRRHPTVGVGAQYELDGDAPLGSDGDHWGVGVTLRLPLFDGTETRYDVAQAAAQRRRLEAMRNAARQGVRLQISAADSELRSALARRAAAAAAVEQASEALRITRERYGEGLALAVELVGAEASRSGARGRLAAAGRDLALARAQLDLASGDGLAAVAMTSDELTTSDEETMR